MKTIVIGAGIAGLTAAIRISQDGGDVLLVSPSYSECSQSVMAMGGINGALNTKGEDDSVDEHFKDTLNAGKNLNQPKAVRKLTNNAPKLIKWLESIGTSFSRDENNNIDLRYFGGQKKMRTAFAGAKTGKQIITALNSLCRYEEVNGNITRMVGWRFIKAIIVDNECIGVILLNINTNEIKSVYGDSVIIATGGMNKLFGKTSGTVENDGFATGKLFEQGVELGNLEMVQYHPTTINTSIKRMLITEAARGEGGRLYVLKDGKPWYFMEEWFPEFGALMPRDVVSQCIYKVCNEYDLGINGENQVYLDITHLDDDVVDKKLDAVVSVCEDYLGINPKEEPIPVYPGVHYFMGGIMTDENHKTNIKRLFAVGECSCQYHGANRLGGNSLLGAIHGGYVAAEESLKLDSLDFKSFEKVAFEVLNKEINNFKIWDEMDSEFEDNKDTDDVKLINEIEDSLLNIMNSNLAIIRNEYDLNKGILEIDQLLNIEINSRGDYYKYLRIQPLLLIGKAMLLSALERKESRGAHQRKEYPELNEDYRKTTSVLYDNGEINISFKEIIEDN